MTEGPESRMFRPLRPSDKKTRGNLYENKQTFNISRTPDDRTYGKRPGEGSPEERLHRGRHRKLRRHRHAERAAGKPLQLLGCSTVHQLERQGTACGHRRRLVLPRRVETGTGRRHEHHEASGLLGRAGHD